MTRRRWIADEVSGSRSFLVGAHAEHLARVLRARVGQEFDIVTRNVVRRGHITAITSDRVEFELGAEIPAAHGVQVTLALSIFKFDRMEWAIEKCTELGVARIVPVIARRTEAHLAAAAPKRVERWQRIVKQASEQSRRSSTPEVAMPLKLKDGMAMTASHRIVLSETEKCARLKDCLSANDNGDLLLAIGPEGGWTQDELDLFEQSGWKAASLGSTILRAETAAVAAATLAISTMR